MIEAVLFIQVINQSIPINDIAKWANSSPANSKFIILDSCNSGSAGESSICSSISEIGQGVTILTACNSMQYASEKNGSGVFTTLFVDALNGAAANLMGEISPGGIYAHIDQSLGAWSQRPVFKTNVENFVSLRKTQAPLELDDLL